MEKNADILLVDDLPEQLRKIPKRPSGHMSLMAVSAMFNFYLYSKLPGISLGKGEQTYGSKAARSINPAEWKEQCKIKHQGRNELCACGSGKKCKKCCNNNLKINQEKISDEDK